MTHSFFSRGNTLRTIRDSLRKVKYSCLTRNIRNKIIIVILFLKSYLIFTNCCTIAEAFISLNKDYLLYFIARKYINMNFYTISYAYCSPFATLILNYGQIISEHYNSGLILHFGIIDQLTGQHYSYLPTAEPLVYYFSLKYPKYFILFRIALIQKLALKN